MKCILIAFCVIFICCNDQKGESLEIIPLDLQPNWIGIDIDQLPVKFGQILNFKKDNETFNAIVLDFNQDEEGIWIGFCFIKDNKLFGRQIPSGLINTKCMDLMDCVYLNLNNLNHYQSESYLQINKNKIGFGSITSVSNLHELKSKFDQGIEQRKKKQTPCEKVLTNLNPIRECYFELAKIKI